MLFCTWQFAVFFITVLAVYWRLPSDRLRVYLLLGASFFFYASWEPRLALLIVASTTIDYWLARGIEASSVPRRRKLLLALNITGNLGLLCFFKYTNFFLSTISEGLLRAGLTESAIRPLELLLPVGISFYTFEAISYMVDVYQGRVKAERNLAHFQLFILFFPHLVAGPIVRGRDFLPQIRRRKRFNWVRFNWGAQLFVMGLFKKLAIADRMALFAEPMFKDPEAFRSSAVWMGVLAYALQIYGDFSGYTDMALGCAHMLGYRLTLNFNMPYLARNVSEFWRRWHMSLSGWLRDYLFIPLGGSRGGSWRTCRNLMLTMTLGGLWHGARWTFVVWGVLHGTYLIVHRVFRSTTERRPVIRKALESPPGTVVCWALTLLAVLVGWVFFRATTFGAAVEVLHRMVVWQPGGGLSLHGIGLWSTLLLVVVCHASGAGGWWKRWSVLLPEPVLGAGYALAFTLAQALAPPTSPAFIYFQF